MNSNARTLAGSGALFLIWAVLTGATVAWRLVFMWGSLVVLLHLLLLYWSSNLSCSLEVRAKGVNHEGNFEITYVFANNGLIPIPWCQVAIHLDKELGTFAFNPESMAFSISEIKAIREQFRCPRRGVYSVGRTTVLFRDLLGLKNRLIHFDKQVSVEVFPHKYPVESLLSSGGEEGGGLRGNWTAEQDYTSISRLREALPQEPSRHIHWKASARTEELQIREYETRKRRGITILLDNCMEKYADDSDGQIEERCVEVAAGLVSHWISRRYDVELVTGSGAVLRLNGAESLDHAMRTLMIFRPEGHELLNHMFSALKTGKRQGSVIQVVTPEMSSQEIFSVMNTANNDVSVFLVGSDKCAVPDSLSIVRIPV